MFRIFVIGLVICQAAAVVTNKAEAQRREAPADTYGPPSLPLDLPAPVYGIPTGPVAHYPPPPPDVPPPPPSTQYGVPVQHYGAPKVHQEYGVPKAHFAPKPVYGPPQGHHQFQQQHHHIHHHQAQHEVSFLDQLKSTFGFGSPAPSYGPPPQQRKPHFPKPSYGPPAGPLLPPTKNFANFGTSSSFSTGSGSAGALLPPTKNFGSFGSSASFTSSGISGHSSSGSGHSAHIAGPIPTYGPPPHLGPHFNPDVRCDGWKPIPGPAIQPGSGYGLPSGGGAVSGSGYNGNVDFGKQVIESSHVESHSHGLENSNQGIIFDLPKLEVSQPFHVESNNFGHAEANNFGQVESNSFGQGESHSFGQGESHSFSHGESSNFGHAESNSFSHGGLNSGKSNSFEISTNGISDTYGPPAPVQTSYGPPAPVTSYNPPAPITSYGPPKSVHTYLPPGPPKQFISRPNSGLLPPSGVYGVPPGGSYNSHSLAISHGSVSGNLKPWPVSGTAPSRPIVHRQPVPHGLIESIGHHVKHVDQRFNGNFHHHQHHHQQQHQHQQNTYLPPQIIDIQTPHGLNSLPLENSARPFLTQHNTQINHQALPLIHESRGVIGGNDCGHGPSNLHLQQQFHVPQPIQDSYGPPPSGNIFTSQSASFGNIEGHSNFNGGSISSSFELPAGHTPHAEYGVPNFGNDNYAFGSSLKSETVKITGEKVNVQPRENALTIDEKPSKTLEAPSNQQQAEQKPQQQQQQQPAPIASPLSTQAGGEYEDEATRLDVAGLTGLNVVSAQKSQSITIPVEGARGNYELQFQSTDQTGSASAPHEQLLTEGLLQQILSAIEQPGQPEGVQTKNAPQVTQEAHTDHDDVQIFLKSPEADPIINEPPMV